MSIAENRHFHLYLNNPRISPSNNTNADGFVFDLGSDDMAGCLNEIALATSNPDAFNANQVRIWRDGEGYSFKLPDSYWEGLNDG